MSVSDKLKSTFQKVKFKVKKDPNKHSSSTSNTKGNKSFFIMVFLAFFSAIIFSSILIAAPLVEEIIPNVRYDLNLNTGVKKQSFKISATDTDINKVTADINTIESKLRNIGFKDIDISNITSTEADGVKTFTFSINVESSQDLSYASQAISDRSDIKLLTVKEGFDPSDANNQTNAILPDNYNSTKFDHSYFRNAQLQKLKDSAGSYSYFLSLKAYPKETLEINKFLTENNGKYIGIQLGDYVVPKQLASEQLNTLFIYITQDEKQAEFYSAMFSAQPMKSKLAITETTDETPMGYNINSYYILAMVTAWGILFAALTYFLKGRSTKSAVMYFLSYGITLAMLISIYKITANPFTTWTFPIATLILSIVLYVGSYYLTFAVLIIELMLAWIVLGFENQIIIQSIYLILIGVVNKYMIEIYINKLKAMLIK